jgi:uncharacterized membrane protein YccC
VTSPRELPLPVRHPVAWLRAHDADLAALRRATRTAVVMPSVFALGIHVIGDPTVATFAAFGSFAMLLLADFDGRVRDRLQAQALLAVTGAALVTLATLAGAHAWSAAVAMALVAFVVLFAGVTSSVIAGAATSLLIAFVLPVTTPGGWASLPPRLAGWGIAGAAALVATAVLWPAPPRHPLRAPAIEATRRLADRLRAEAGYRRGDPGWTAAEVDAAIERSRAGLAALQAVFYLAPYRPGGLSTPARTVLRLVDELGWLGQMLDGEDQDTTSGPPGQGDPTVCAVKVAAADVLDQGAELLEAPEDRSRGIDHAARHLRVAVRAMEQHAMHSLPVRRTPAGAGDIADFVSSLEPSFRAQEVSYAVSLIATNVALAAAAERRTWWAQLLGHQPAGVQGSLRAARQRARGHLRRHSVWLHNSIRGATALSLAVLVADLTGVQHSFWVVLGTLSVLRSNALSTGQNVVRSLLGTSTGVVVGGVIVGAIGTDTTVLWLLLPVAIVVAGVAPATVSFAAGQGAFTVTLLILYNIVAPIGWQVGLIRVEDIAVGSAVSLAVGLLFWPRGASRELRAALADAYAAGAAYLARAVAFAVHRCDATAAAAPAPTEAAVRAAAAARRLDDVFRTFLVERGPKAVTLAEVTNLVTGVAVLRLAADAIAQLWASGASAADGDRSAARREVVRQTADVAGWYDAFATALRGRRAIPDPVPPDRVAGGRLIAAVRRDLADVHGHGTATGVRLIWTADHLDAARRLQGELAASAARAPVPAVPPARRGGGVAERSAAVPTG